MIDALKGERKVQSIPNILSLQDLSRLRYALIYLNPPEMDFTTEHARPNLLLITIFKSSACIAKRATLQMEDHAYFELSKQICRLK